MYEDELLMFYAQAATAMVEAYTGRSLVSQTLNMVSTGTLAAASVPMSPGPLAVYPLAYNTVLSSPYRRIELIRSPVSVVNSVSITRQDGTTYVLDPDAYMVDTDTDPAAVVMTGFTLLPTDRMTVNYTAGYGPTGATVPACLANAVCWLVGYMYSHRGDDEMNEMPKLMRHLCDPYRLAFFGSISPDGR